MEISLWEVLTNEWFFIEQENIIEVPHVSSVIAIEGIDVLKIDLEDLSLQFKEYISNSNSIDKSDIFSNLEDFFASKGFNGLDIYFLDEFPDMEDLLIYFYENTHRFFSNLNRTDTFKGYVWEKGFENEYISESQLGSNPIDLTLNDDSVDLNDKETVYKVEKKNNKSVIDLYVIKKSSIWTSYHEIGIILTKKELEEHLLKMNYDVEVCMEEILNIGKVHN